VGLGRESARLMHETLTEVRDIDDPSVGPPARNLPCLTSLDLSRNNIPENRRWQLHAMQVSPRY
jgi:hypothetical protein